ncbi:MAG: bifunctional precorrin-2 dehydrogenase/sirohydrochlorin ferrochelatase [Bacteroidota bacterium]
MEGNVLFPVFLKLDRLHTLLVGGGYVGLEKLEAILRNSPEAKVTICAKEVLQEKILTLAESHPHISIIARPYEKKFLKGKDVVIMATDSRDLHEKIKIHCRKRHILANVADTPDLCDFYLGSVVKKGDLKIAISSNGKSPTITKRIREYLEEAIPDDIQILLDKMKEIRDQLKGDFEYKVKELNRMTKSWNGNS